MISSSVELGWAFMRSADILPVEVLGAMRGIQICLAKKFDNVSFQTDAKTVEQLIHNDIYFREACSKNIIDKNTRDYISYSRAVLQKTHWPLGYVPRQANMAADYIAKYARILKQSRWPDSRDYEHLQDVHMNGERIYMTNAIPHGLKGILTNDMGLFPIIGKKLAARHVYDVKVPMSEVNQHTTNNVENMAEWRAELAYLMGQKYLKCFYVEIYNVDALVEQLEATVKYNIMKTTYSDMMLYEMLHGFDVLNQMVYQVAYKLRARLVFQLWNNENCQKKQLLEPLARVKYPATQLDLGNFDFDDVSLQLKITTRYGRIRGYDEWDVVLQNYKQGLKNIPEYDFGVSMLQDNLVFPAEEILYNEI
ncbi:uncharacterized protein LOC133865140 isoform X2 [Alnus glutinosa]|uniref:uncharacterized protein LOC133865140 isoform X2 n=1 Tax=Alnus glutinosa TaxID=3517 RepID=UPI002D78A43D|nr:uncharacterized protein LOC133865140 isoform X2 [Alnus glutinosa]